MSRQAIYDAIETERAHQDGRWGHQADDTLNSPNDWVSFIAKYSTRWLPGGFPPYDLTTVEAFRECMVKVAALAVAAIESIDRQTAKNGKPFYQE